MIGLGIYGIYRCFRPKALVPEEIEFSWVEVPAEACCDHTCDDDRNVVYYTDEAGKIQERVEEPECTAECCVLPYPEGPPNVEIKGYPDPHEEARVDALTNWDKAQALAVEAAKLRLTRRYCLGTGCTSIPGNGRDFCKNCAGGWRDDGN
jgi:hypothetical protein